MSNIIFAQGIFYLMLYAAMDGEEEGGVRRVRCTTPHHHYSHLGSIECNTR